MTSDDIPDRKHLARRPQEPGYEVGYGKPPAETRFRKGRSGNPGGRPKGSKSAKSLLEQALAAPVSINEGGKSRVIEQRLALFKSLVARAIKGDARAAALVVKLMEQFEINTPRSTHVPVTRIERIIVRPGDPGTSSVWRPKGEASGAGLARTCTCSPTGRPHAPTRARTTGEVTASRRGCNALSARPILQSPRVGPKHPGAAWAKPSLRARSWGWNERR